MPNIFEQLNVPLPHITSQATWHYSLGEHFLNLSDGTRTYSFIGKLERNAELKRIPDIPLPDFYSHAKVKGKVQVHQSDSSNIHFTIQDGSKNPTYILRHVDGDAWSVQPSGGGLVFVQVVDGKVLQVEVDDKPQVNQPVRNRERALLLQELISTDPVISKFPAHHVVDAYQQMLMIAPELCSEKEIVRAYLRQAGASSQIDQRQADALIAENIRLFKMHQACKQNSSPVESKPVMEQ